VVHLLLPFTVAFNLALSCLELFGIAFLAFLPYLDRSGRQLGAAELLFIVIASSLIVEGDAVLKERAQ